MRTAVLLGRFCLNSGGRSPQLLSRLAPPSRLRFARPPSWPRGQFRGGSSKRNAPVGRTVLLATLTPGAFLELAEEGDGNGKTGEMQMLEISRQEIRKSVEEDARGLTRLRQCLSVWWFCYIYDPIATGFRFIHLVVIFMPVILTFPAVWLGKRLKDRSGERTGTLWWFQFLVRSMERAGPAFIKVGGFSDSCRNTNKYLRTALFLDSLDNGQHPEPISSPQNYAALCPLSIPMRLRIHYMRPRKR